MFQQYGADDGVDVQKTASFFKIGIKGTATRLAGCRAHRGERRGNVSVSDERHQILTQPRARAPGTSIPHPQHTHPTPPSLPAMCAARGNMISTTAHQIKTTNYFIFLVSSLNSINLFFLFNRKEHLICGKSYSQVYVTRICLFPERVYSFRLKYSFDVFLNFTRFV